jgi:uncharacterized phage protein gp47/JayE
MPFDRPSPVDLLARAQAEMDLALPGSDARLRSSVEGVMARVVSMAAHEMFGFLSWNAEQILPDTAESEYLERHGALWGIARKAATHATGVVEMTGTIGATIPAATILQRGDGIDYVTTSSAIFSGTTVNVPVEGLIAGAVANAATLTKLNLVSPIAGVQTTAVVGGDGLSGGTDVEKDPDYRSRIIARIQNPPHGGASFDYIAWMKEVSGVTRAWVYPNQLGLGTVVGIFVMDDKTPTIIPSAPEVGVVQDHVDAVRPVTAEVTIIAPTAVALNFEIHVSPLTNTVKAAIEAELKDLIRRESEPGGTLYISRIREAISVAEGEFDHVLIAPTSNVVRAFGEIAVLGTITWGAM